MKKYKEHIKLNEKQFFFLLIHLMFKDLRF